jgi:hypothetical protein
MLSLCIILTLCIIMDCSEFICYVCNDIKIFKISVVHADGYTKSCYLWPGHRVLQPNKPGTYVTAKCETSVYHSISSTGFQIWIEFAYNLLSG